MFTSQLLDSEFLPIEGGLYQSGVYTLWIPATRNAYVGRANCAVWERLQDHYKRPRSEFDEVFHWAFEFKVAVYACTPTSHIEGTSILRAKKWCKENNAESLNIAIPKYATLNAAERDAHCRQFASQFLPSGDAICEEIQGK